MDNIQKSVLAVLGISAVLAIVVPEVTQSLSPTPQANDPTKKDKPLGPEDGADGKNSEESYDKFDDSDSYNDNDSDSDSNWDDDDSDSDDDDNDYEDNQPTIYPSEKRSSPRDDGFGSSSDNSGAAVAQPGQSGPNASPSPSQSMQAAAN